MNFFVFCYYQTASSELCIIHSTATMVKKRVLYSSDSDDDREQMQIKKYKSKLNNNDHDPIKLTDLKDDILLLTLDELSLNDLSSVAMVSMRFNRLVYSYLGEKCSTGRVTISGTRTADWLWTSNTMGKFKFDSPAEFVAFLRVSGHLISHLTIDCDHNYRESTFEFMARAIFKYCLNAVEIAIRTNFLPVLNASIKYPLADVTMLKLDTCELDAGFGVQLNRLFPSLQRLVLNECKAIEPACIEIHMPDLIDFKFSGLMKNRMVLKKPNILKFIELNPQIQRLAVDFQEANRPAGGVKVDDFELNSAFYRCVREYLPDLEWLKMVNKRCYDEPIAWCGSKIEFPNLTTFELADIYDQQPNAIAPFEFQQLQELKLKHMKKLTDEWMDFITANEQLTKLTVQIYGKWRVTSDEGAVIKHRYKINKEQLLAILKRLPHLEELHVDAETVNAKDIVAVLAKRKSLMTVTLRDYFVVDSIVDTFDQLIGKKPWLVDYDLENLYLKRV